MVKKMRFSVLGILVILLLTGMFIREAGAIVFNDDFETGNLSKWVVSAPAGTAAITASIKKAGTYGLSSVDSSTSASDAYIYKSSLNEKELYCRFYVYVPYGYYSQFLSGDYRSAFWIINSSGPQIRFRADNGNFTVQENFSWVWKTSTVVPQEDTWYCIEIRAPQCSTNATIEWWVDGIAQPSLTGANMWSSNNYWTRINMGLQGGTGTGAMAQTAYFDEVVLSSTGYIGPLPAGPSAGNLQFSAASYNVNENAGSATITVRRTVGTTGAVSVQYATSNGTAVSGSDYTAKTGTLNWADGDSADKTFTVAITNDTGAESSETINLALSNPTNGSALGSPSGAVLTINDDDSPGSLQFSASNFSVGENGGSVTVTVTRSGGSAGAVTVQYATSNGSAVSGSDYTAKTGTVGWANADIASKTFTIGIINDTAQESSETVNLNLSNPAGGATLGTPNTASVTIADDEQVSDEYLWLHVDGKYIKTSASASPPNQVFRVTGVCYPRGASAGTNDLGAANYAKSHYCNSIRLPIACNSFSAITPPQTDINGVMTNFINPWLQQAQQSKLYTFLDNHQFYLSAGRNQPLTSGEIETLCQSWEALAQAYKDNPLVFYEIWNEVFFSGAVTALQSVITRIRAIDKKHIIQLPEDDPSVFDDTGVTPHQLVFGHHDYPFDNAATFLNGMAAKMNTYNVPYICTEFGAAGGSNCTTWASAYTWLTDWYDWLAQNKASSPMGTLIWYMRGGYTNNQFEGMDPGYFDVWVEGVKEIASETPSNGVSARVSVEAAPNWSVGLNTGGEMILTVKIKDSGDSTVVTSNAALNFSISGPGILQDIPTNVTGGKATVKVKAGTTPGTITVTAASGSLAQGQLDIPVVNRWASFESQKLDSAWISEAERNDDTTPNVRVKIQDNASGLEITTARYEYSKDGGSTWIYWNPAASDEFDDGALNARWTAENHNTTGGSVSESGGKLNITGSGRATYSTWSNDWWCLMQPGSYDEFYYVHETKTNGYEVITKIDSQQNTNPWALAGIMARKSMTDSNTNCIVYVAVTPGNGFVFAWKSMGSGTSNGNAQTNFKYVDARVTKGTSFYPCYLKLVKQSNPNYYVGWDTYYTYSGWYSSDGQNWTLIYKRPSKWADNTENVGPFVSPGASGTGLAVFDFYRSQLYATCSGSNYTTAQETINISAVPFNQVSQNNRIRIKIRPKMNFLYFDTVGSENPEFVSSAYTVMTGQAGPPAKLMLSANPWSIRANGTSTALITARVTDINGYTCNEATHTITFGVTGDGTLQGSLVVQAVEGLATVTLRSTTNPGSAHVTGTANPLLTAGYVDVPTYGNAVKISVAADNASIPANGISSATVTASVLDSGDRVVLDDTTQLAFTITGVGTFLDGSKTKNSMLEDGRAVLPVISKSVGSFTITVTGGSLAQDSESVEALRNYTNGDTVLKTSASGVVRLVIPPNSLDKNVIVGIRSKNEILVFDAALSGKIDTACRPVSQSGTIPDEDIDSGQLKYSGSLWDSSIHDFNPVDVETGLETTVNFNPAATLVLPYSETGGNITGTDISESTLAIYFLNETNSTWEKQASTVNTEMNEVSLSLTHLSAYCLMGGAGGEPIVGEITNVAAYPNPFNPASGTGNVKFIYNLPSAGDVRVEVFTLAGKLITTLTRTGAAAGYGEISWDGTDDDANEIANGLYLYKMTLTSGGSETSKIGKLAKIR